MPNAGGLWDENVLIFSHVALWDSHHAESVELALCEYNKGNKVFFISCVGALETCPANPNKNNKKCILCRLQTRRTTNKILQGIKINLSLKEDNKKSFV